MTLMEVSGIVRGDVYVYEKEGDFFAVFAGNLNGCKCKTLEAYRLRKVDKLEAQSDEDSTYINIYMSE